MALTQKQRKGLIHLLLLGGLLVLKNGGGYLFRPTPPEVDFAVLDSLFQVQYDSIKTYQRPAEVSKPALRASHAPLVHAININTATEAELVRLPRIGPAIARRIIRYRQQKGKFRSIDELIKVKGIGPKTLQHIRPYVTIK